MRNIIKRTFSIIICFLMLVNLFLPFQFEPVKVLANDTGNTDSMEPLKILELQPGKTFDISGNSQLIADIEGQLGRNISVDPVSMVEFVSRVDEVNGKYDIVYVGNNNSGGDYYSKFGSKSGKLPDGTTQMSGSNDVEYYSGIDITNLSANKIKEFTRAGQLTIFDGSIFSDDYMNTKLYNNFYSEEETSDFYKNTKYPNFVVLERNSENTLFMPVDGFIGEYYRNKNFNNIGNLLEHDKIDFTWDEPVWPGPQDDDKFKNGNHEISIRWSAAFKVESSAKYNFSASYDGDAALKIADKSTVYRKEYNNKYTWSGDFDTIFDDDSSWDDDVHSGEIYLDKNKEYVLLLEYIPDRDDDNNIFAHLYWKSNGARTSKLLEALAKYNNSDIRKRPSLELTSKPVEYNGSNSVEGANKIMGYTMNISASNGNGSMITCLFIDNNGDGIFSDDEKVESINGKSGEGYSINHMLPESYTGLQPWKIEVTDEFGAKNYQKGAVAFKGREREIHVLQLLPDKNKLSLKSLGSLLKRPGEYNIIVDEMSIKDFDNSYNTANPVQLNGKYNMVVLGFADIYPGGDLKVQGAIDALDSFIKTNQSVMFTHDTISSMAFSNSSWGGKNLTKYYRDLLGQNVFLDGHQDLPESGKKSLGFTRLALDLANGKGIPNTPVAYKLNDTLLSKYPYVLPDEVSVALTHHQYFQLDLEDPQVIPVFTLKNEKIYNHDTHKVIGPVETRFNNLDGRNDYYTYTKGNITYSGTGHTPPNGLPEKQLFVNTMIKAARGANNAPSLTIGGISDNQEISNTVTSLDLSLLAVDDQDKYLGGCIKIYADLNNNGSYEDNEITIVETFDINSEDTRIESGVNKNITIPKSVPSTLGKFVVSVEVYDKDNALTKKDITLIQKDEPTLTITNNIQTGYLIGDRIQGTVSVPANKSNTDYIDNYTGITLTAGLPQTAELASAGWNGVPESANSVTTSLQDVAFTPDPSVSSQSKNISFICSGTAGQRVDVPLSLKYTNGSGITKEVNSNISYSVKAGGVSVQVLDAKHRSIGNVTVSVKKSGVTDGTPVEAVTDSSGKASIENLASGGYEVTINMPEGYAATPGTPLVRNLNLSYQNPSQLITYELTGSPISNLSFTNESGTNEDKIFIRNGNIVNDDRTAKILYFLNRDVISGEIKLEGNVSGLAIKSVMVEDSEGNTAECTISNWKLQIPENYLKRGNYTIHLNYSIDKNAQSGEYFGLSQADAFYVREANAGASDPLDSYGPTSTAYKTVFNVSQSVINEITLTNINSSRDDIHVVENGSTQVLVKFRLNDPASITSINLIYKGSPLVNCIPVDLKSLEKGTIDISGELNNIVLQPGDYTATLFINGTQDFTTVNSTGKLQLVNVYTLENIEGSNFEIENVADVNTGSLNVIIDGLYNLE